MLEPEGDSNATVKLMAKSKDPLCLTHSKNEWGWFFFHQYSLIFIVLGAVYYDNCSDIPTLPTLLVVLGASMTTENNLET